MEFIKDESKNSQIIKISKFNSLKNPQKLAKKLEIYKGLLAKNLLKPCKSELSHENINHLRINLSRPQSSLTDFQRKSHGSLDFKAFSYEKKDFLRLKAEFPHENVENLREKTEKTGNIGEYLEKPLKEYVKELNILEKTDKVQRITRKNNSLFGFSGKKSYVPEGKTEKNLIKMGVFPEKEQILLKLYGEKDRFNGKSEAFIGEKLYFARVDQQKSSVFQQKSSFFPINREKNTKKTANINYETYKVSKKYSHIVGNMARTAKVQNLFNISQTQLMIIKRKNSKKGLVSPCEAVKSFYKSMLVQPKNSRCLEEFFIGDERKKI